MSLIGMIVTPILIYFGVIFVVQLIVSLYKINSAGYYANDTISQFPEILSKQEVIRKDEKNMVTMRTMPQSQQQGQLKEYINPNQRLKHIRDLTQQFRKALDAKEPLLFSEWLHRIEEEKDECYFEVAAIMKQISKR